MPRSRGVYFGDERVRGAYQGSSPLARGLRTRRPDRRRQQRIIPARAGFTSAVARPTRPPSDHPRSRGVYETALAEILEHQGSSPLARGLHFPAVLADEHFGIIPARAGFTCKARTGSSAKRDHPRSRGVYSITNRRMPCPSGSSPLARGLLDQEAVVVRGDGIIPARAGFTSSRRSRPA